MQFKKNTSLGKNNLVALVIKFSLGLIVIVGLVLFLNKIDFPAPKKEIEKIISNENLKVVK